VVPKVLRHQNPRSKSNDFNKNCRSWVKEARWATDNTELIVFYRKYGDVLAHFVHLLAESEAKDVLQPKIPGFEAPKNKNAN